MNRIAKNRCSHRLFALPRALALGCARRPRRRRTGRRGRCELILPLGAGSGADIGARLVAEKLVGEMGPAGGGGEPSRRRRLRRDHRVHQRARRSHAVLRARRRRSPRIPTCTRSCRTIRATSRRSRACQRHARSRSACRHRSNVNSLGDLVATARARARQAQLGDRHRRDRPGARGVPQDARASTWQGALPRSGAGAERRGRRPPALLLVVATPSCAARSRPAASSFWPSPRREPSKLVPGVPTVIAGRLSRADLRRTGRLLRIARHAERIARADRNRRARRCWPIPRIVQPTGGHRPGGRSGLGRGVRRRDRQAAHGASPRSPRCWASRRRNSGPSPHGAGFPFAGRGAYKAATPWRCGEFASAGKTLGRRNGQIDWQRRSTCSTARTSTCSAPASRRFMAARRSRTSRSSAARPPSAHGFAIEFRQSNHEGEIVDWIQEAGAKKAAGIVINPARPHPHLGRDATTRSRRISVPVIEVPHQQHPRARSLAPSLLCLVRPPRP